MSISAIVLKIASRCNLNCSYCYMYQHADQSYLRQPKFISDRVFDRTLAVMADYCRGESGPSSMALIFHGGEPTLVGLDRFQALVARAKQVLGKHLLLIGIQTNAVLLTPQWVEVFRQQQVRVHVSLDGPAAVHDAVRVDHQGRGSHERTLAGIEKLIAGGLTPKILSVVNPDSSGGEVYRYFRSLGIRTIDFLLPDVSHDSFAQFYGHLPPNAVANFLIGAFDAWLEEDNVAVDVRLFSDLIKSFLGQAPGSDAFGNPLMSYLIIDTDGSIEAMDALRVCDEGIASSNLNICRHNFDDLADGLPLVNKAVHRGFPLPTACSHCPERRVCGGGHLPHRYSRATQFDNPSVWCADILRFFSHVRQKTGISLPQKDHISSRFPSGRGDAGARLPREHQVT